ncbi:arginyltransferase [Reinekea sp.]|jgi:arginine-tRNA-protein transferase|uniref:arginyltransferase n=1 Tax=Reinekea sp. TaxID=1970455 RepID=UPI002A8118AD|nr:arginyltransferase [Reinekea sp.]
MTDAETLPEGTIKLFRTSEHDCSYLADRQSRTLFLDPELNFSLDLYEELSQAGFRRSGKHLFRPDCKTCNACIPSRVPIQAFQAKKSQQRILNKNQDIKISVQPCVFRQADYDLFERYIAQRHADGEMYPASEATYTDFLAINNEFSFQLHLTLDERLVAVAVTDRLHSGLSAIYTFFDPDLEKRSLGVFSILSQIALAKQWGLANLYLGYWVPGCRKMQYKTQYQPTELLIDGQWQAIGHKQ